MPDDPTAAARPHLEVVSAEAGYGTVPIITDVSLEVRPGEIVTVVGPNGAGKSTLLKAIVGSLRLTAGEVRLAGNRVDHLATQQLARIGMGYVPQSDDVFTPLSVREILLLGGYMCGRRVIQERVEQVYQLFPLCAGCRAGRLGSSAGGSARCWPSAGR